MRGDFSVDTLKRRLEQVCLFCDPGDQADQIIGETRHFYLFVALGQIVEGYLLIVSRAHAHCIAELSAGELLELTNIQYVIRRMYREAYDQTTQFFEHGMSGRCLIHSTRHCYHAHLHCVPAAVDLLPGIASVLLPHRIDQLADLAQTTQGEPYLYYERELKHVFIQRRPLASQFLRRQLASAIGAPETADWMAFPTLDRVATARKQLHTWLSEQQPIGVTPVAELLTGALVNTSISRVEQTIAAYDRIAAEYTNVWFDQLLTDLLDSFVALLDDRRIVLDAACGPGRDTRYLIHRGVHVIGVDLSIGMLQEARFRVPEGTFYQMDIRHLRFPANYFSGIWASAALVHIPRDEVLLTLRSFARALAPRGILFVAVHESDATTEDGRFALDGRYFVRYSEEDLRQWLLEAGFTIEDTQRRVSQRSTHSNSAAVRWLNLRARKIG